MVALVIVRGFPRLSVQQVHPLVGDPDLESRLVAAQSDEVNNLLNGKIATNIRIEVTENFRHGQKTINGTMNASTIVVATWKVPPWTSKCIPCHPFSPTEANVLT